MTPAGRRAPRALLVAMAVVGCGVLPGFLIGSLTPRIRADFAFTDSALGLTIAVFNVVSAVASSPAGHLAERIGGTGAVRLATALVAVCCAGFALSVNSAAGVAVALVIGGLGNALAGPAASIVLRREVAGHRHGLAYGAQQSSAPFAALLSGLALPLIAIPFGWRWAFVAAGALGAVAALAVPSGRRAPVTPLAPPPAGPTRRHGPTRVHALAVTAALASAASAGMVSFLVVYAVERGMSEGQAGLLLSGVSLAGGAGRVALGVHVDRSGSDPLRPVAGMLASSVAGYGLMLSGEPVVVAAGALLVGALGWAWSGALTLSAVQRSPEAPGWAVGVMLTGLFAGAVSGPLAIGVLAEHEAFSAAWIMCAVLSLAAAGTVALIRRRAGTAQAAS
jgi:MFS family permease